MLQNQQIEEVIDLIKKRGSVRNFEDKDIPDDILKNILDTGIRAASGGNLQPFSIIVVKDKENRRKLHKICGQPFILCAPINLIFVLDWHKMETFALNQNAPFTCTDSYMHYLIGLEDVMCAAQMIETTAFLYGIGSCYIGSPNHHGDKMVEAYKLPKSTYPVLILSMGYPKNEIKQAKKLKYDFMVFDENYPDLSDDEIANAYFEKYGLDKIKLPNKEPFFTESIDRLNKALHTTYNEIDSKNILDGITDSKEINEIQRRFGLHYNAKEMRELGYKVINMMKKQGLTPFNIKEDK